VIAVIVVTSYDNLFTPSTSVDAIWYHCDGCEITCCSDV